jgi:hypothetical protein
MSPHSATLGVVPFAILALLLTHSEAFSNPDTAKRPGGNLPKDAKLRIGVIRRVEVTVPTWSIRSLPVAVRGTTTLSTTLRVDRQFETAWHATLDLLGTILDSRERWAQRDRGREGESRTSVHACFDSYRALPPKT